MDTETKRPTIHDRIEEWGISIASKQVSHNPNMGDPMEGGSHWEVTLSRAGVPDLKTSYSMGAAHRRWILPGKGKAPSAVGYSVRRVDPGQVAPPDIRAKYSPVKEWREKETLDLREMRRTCTEPTPPDAADVLNCLALDASSYDNARTFEEWARDFGYDVDSRKAEKIYKAVAEGAKALRHFMGKHYDALVNETEQL